MQIHKNLDAAGINPADITKVLMTHLHKDHAGGVSEDMHHKQLSFPSATYYVQQREFEFALKRGCLLLFRRVAGVEKSPKVVLLKDDEG